MKIGLLGNFSIYYSSHRKSLSILAQRVKLLQLGEKTSWSTFNHLILTILWLLQSVYQRGIWYRWFIVTFGYFSNIVWNYFKILCCALTCQTKFEIVVRICAAIRDIGKYLGVILWCFYPVLMLVTLSSCSRLLIEAEIKLSRCHLLEYLWFYINIRLQNTYFIIFREILDAVLNVSLK